MHLFGVSIFMAGDIPVFMIGATNTFSMPFIAGHLSNNCVHADLDKGLVDAEVRNSNVSVEALV